MISQKRRPVRIDPVVSLIAAKRRHEAVLASPDASDRERVAALHRIGRIERRLLRQRAETPEGGLASLELLLWELDGNGGGIEPAFLHSLAAGALSQFQRQCAQQLPESR
jgi:hypothetical protein